MTAIQIQADDYLTSHRARGLALRLSTYDIPRSARAEFDEKAGVLHILFDYIDHEPSRTQRLTAAEHTCVKVGKHSGKILGFEISTEKYKIKEVLVMVGKALEDQIPHLSRYNEQENYRFVNTVLEKLGPPLAEAAAG